MNHSVHADVTKPDQEETAREVTPISVAFTVLCLICIYFLIVWREKKELKHGQSD